MWNLYAIKKNTFPDFIITSGVNFLSITTLLYFFLLLVPDVSMATLLAHVIGLLISMAFTLDFWWIKISNNSETQVRAVQRLKFLCIGSVAAFLSWFSVQELSKITTLTKLAVITLNWSIIGIIAIIKYALFSYFLQK